MLTTEFVSFQNNPNNGDIMRFLSHIDVSKRVLHASDRDLVDLLYLKKEAVVVPALYKYTISEEEEKNKEARIVPPDQVFFSGFRQSHNSAHQLPSQCKVHY